MENNALGNAIRDARLGLRLSQHKLALLAKTTQTGVWKIENGISKKPQATTLLAINSVLKCDLSGPLQEAGYDETEIAAINRHCKSQNEKNSMENNALGNAIKDARLALGLSQRKLASLTKITQTDVSRIENGISEKPQLGTLAAISRVLKCDLSVPLREAGYSEAKIATISKHWRSQNENMTVVVTAISAKDAELAKAFLDNISKLSEEDKSMIRSILQSRDT